MHDRSLIGVMTLAAALVISSVAASAFDDAKDAKYPDIGGTWVRPGAAQWDPTKPAGLRQQALLTPESQAIFEANLAITAAGGQEYNPQVNCFPAGMPRVMIACTKPWTITRDYNRDPEPIWAENNCGADNHYASLGTETYFISADGYLMPTKKNQPVPALKGFDQSPR
jgi:hypothetical protein